MRKSLVLSVIAMVASTTLASWEKVGAAYEGQSAATKKQALWSEIIANTKSGSFPNALELPGLFIESMDPSIHWVGDTFENGWLGARTKYIHSVGAVAEAKFVPVANSEGYTGMWAEGCDNVFIRYSIAKSDDVTKKTAAQAYDNFTPGIALKFLRDNMRSANLVAMKGVNGQDSWNPFKYDFSNHIATAEGIALQLVAKKFGTATPIIRYVGLSDFAATNQQGQAVSTPKFPFQLIFAPDASVSKLFSDDYQADFKDQLSSLAAGTTIYNVYAIDEPVNGKKVLIGKLNLATKFTTSNFGDTKMFFKHQDMQEDLKIKPHWKSYIEVGKLSECPFKLVREALASLLNP